jgi:hypothetical protein
MVNGLLKSSALIGSLAATGGPGTGRPKLLPNPIQPRLATDAAVRRSLEDQEGREPWTISRTQARLKKASWKKRP